MLLLAVAETVEKTPFGVVIVQLLLFAAVAFLVCAALLSHLRFRRFLADAREELMAGGGSMDAFRIVLTERLNRGLKGAQEFCLFLIERHVPASAPARDAEDQNTLYSLLRKKIEGQLRDGDELILLDGDRLGLIIKTEVRHQWAVVSRIKQGLAKEKVKLSDGDVVSMDVRIGLTTYPQQDVSPSELVDRLEVCLNATNEERMVLRVNAGEGTEYEAPPAKLPVDLTTQVAEGQEHMIDELTGVLKPARVGGAIQKYIAQYRKEEEPVSLILLDVDALDQYNSHYGREAGDAILRNAAAYIMRFCRESDLVGRLSDDEFVIVMPCAPDLALAAAMRIAKEVKQGILEHGGNRLRYTLGAGVAGYPDHSGNPMRMFDMAVLALDHAKMRGRNSCLMFEKRFEQMEIEKDVTVDRF